MTRVKNICTLFLMIFSGIVYAQQRQLYTQFMYNNLTFNPAYAGSQDNIEADFLVREQWVGIDGAPSSQMLAVHGTQPGKNYGLGLVVANDKIASINQIDVSLAGSYKWVITKGKIIMERPYGSLTQSAGRTVYHKKRIGKKTFSLGGQLSYQNYSNNLSSLESNLQGNSFADFSFQENFNKSLLNFGIGGYYHSDRGYVGFSIPTIIRNTLQTNVSKRENHYYLTGGLRYPLNRGFSLEPNFLLRAANNAPVNLDVNTNLVYKQMITVGLSYRFVESIGILTQLQLTKSFRLGYSYDLITNGINAQSGGSHEVMLNYSRDFIKTKFINPRWF